MIRRLIVVVAIGIALAAALRLSVRAQTAEQKSACKPDVLRLCNPNPMDLISHRRVCGCMIANYAQLSAACRALAPIEGLRRCAKGE